MINKPERKIFHITPECWTGCDEPSCPYIHVHTWDVAGHEHNAFTSPDDAQQFVEERGETPVMIG